MRVAPRGAIHLEGNHPETGFAVIVDEIGLMDAAAKKKKKDPCAVDHPEHFVFLKLCSLVSFNGILTSAEATLSRLFCLCRPPPHRISALTSERLTMTSFFPSVHSLLLIYHSESMLPSNHMTTCALRRLPPAPRPSPSICLSLWQLTRDVTDRKGDDHNKSVSGDFFSQHSGTCCAVVLMYNMILYCYSAKKRQKGVHCSNITV